MKTKRITLRQFTQVRIDEHDEEVRTTLYEVIKTVDTIAPEIGEVLDKRKVNEYVNNQRFSVTVIPSPAERS
jgi:hypothetical protein